MSSTDNAAVHRAKLALLVAVLDGDCDLRVHDLLCRSDDPHFAVLVAHRIAHDYTDAIDAADHAEMRTDIVAELHEIAAGGD
jgi:hypothetical protein